MKFDKTYWTDSNRKSFYPKLSSDIQQQFARLNLAIFEDFVCDYQVEKILDYGCGQGYTVQAFSEEKHNIVGIDVSDYALENCVCDKSLVSKFDGFCPDLDSYEYVVSFFVLEHLTMPQLATFCQKLKQSSVKQLIFRVPVPHPDMNPITYSLDDDDTHLQIHDWTWWLKAIEGGTGKTFTCNQFHQCMVSGLHAASFSFIRGRELVLRDLYGQCFIPEFS